MMRHAPAAVLAAFLSLAPSVEAEVRTFEPAVIEQLGVAIYEQDKRAAAATDLLLAQDFDFAQEGLRGWIVDGTARNMRVRFVREREGVTEAFYDVTFRGSRRPSGKRPTNVSLTTAQVVQFKARSLAAKNISQPASDRYNIVILPDPERDGLLVYALAATVEPDAVVIGGHYRFTISKDGDRIEQADQLFKSPLVLSKKPKDAPPGATIAALSVSTLVSDSPLETHVFLSLLHRMPFYVVTRKAETWKVERGKIERVQAE